MNCRPERFFVLTLALLSFNLPTAAEGSNLAQASNCSMLQNQLPIITAALKQNLVGKTRLNKRKTLEIHDINSVLVDGCQLTASLNVTLRRKIRRDASGTIYIRGFFAHRENWCLENIQISTVRVSHTLRLGEAVYRLIGNKVFNGKTYCLTTG